MLLLAVVTCISVTVAGGASLLGLGDTKGDTRSVRLADRVAMPAESVPSPDKSAPSPESPDKRIIDVTDQPPVRVIGAPFVPNTNPRER